MRDDTRMTWVGGIVAGLVAGLVSSVLHAATALTTRTDVWAGVKGAAFPFVGERAMEPGFEPGLVVAGLVSHFFVSAVWGVLFAIAFKGLSRAGTVAAGFFWGVVVWVVMYYVVLPLVGADEITSNTPIWMALISHLAFGGAMGVAFLPFQTPYLRRTWDERDIYLRP
jgi:hypothetical protein